MNMKQRWFLMDEANPDADGGGGGGGESGTIDINKTVDSFAQDLGLTGASESGSASPSPGDEGGEAKPGAGDQNAGDDKTSTEGDDSAGKTEAKAPPKSWAQDKHELWSKTPPEVQAYIEQRENEMSTGAQAVTQEAQIGKAFKELAMPYEAVLRSQGVDAPTAFRFMLDAHYRLSTGDEASRLAAFSQLAKNYGFAPEKITEALGSEAPYVDPHTKQLESRLNKVEQERRAEEDRKVQEISTRVATEVDTFAKDPANLYFNEVSGEVVAFIGLGLSLKEAYDKAVWANPVTRAKEQARLSKEGETAARQRRNEEARRKEAAKGTDVQGRETSKANTDFVGSMDDTMRDTLKGIKEREGAT